MVSCHFVLIKLNEQPKWPVQSKRDDLESLAYTLIYLANEPLPWHSLPAPEMWPNKQRLGELSAARASLSPDDLRQRLPPVFADFLEHARNTNPADSPDYEHFKKAFAVVGSSEI